jgi:hypothetical protein
MEIVVQRAICDEGGGGATPRNHAIMAHDRLIRCVHLKMHFDSSPFPSHCMTHVVIST